MAAGTVEFTHICQYTETHYYFLLLVPPSIKKLAMSPCFLSSASL